ncbi:MAG: MFS transporter, partial [Acidimicrobiales bacterium]
MGAEELASLLRPRDGIVRESAGVEVAPGEWHFGLAGGPLDHYERVVRVGAGGAVAQEVRFRVGIPYVSWLFALPLRSNLAGLRPGRPTPWWAPPALLAHGDAVALSGLCGFAVLAGYLNSLLPTTVTYVGREYHVGDAGQGYALAGVQVGAVVAVGLLVLADRRGRRRSVLAATVAGAAVSALGGLAPSLATVALTQAAALALLTTQYVLLAVLVVELMPAGARAWALALVTMSYGLGGGVTLLVLPLAALGPGGWRWTYAVAALAVPACALFARHVPESGRWTRDVAWRAPAPGPRWTPAQRRRLLLIGAGALLFALFNTPAGQFQNQYLRVQRHWSAVHISIAEQIVGTVGGLGTLAGGRLADTRGRRPVVALALVAGTAFTVVEYFARGAPLYGWMAASSILGYAVAPALAVYGGELFPTALRGRAGGVLNVAAAGGGLAGLAVTGALGSRLGALGPA